MVRATASLAIVKGIVRITSQAIIRLLDVIHKNTNAGCTLLNSSWNEDVVAEVENEKSKTKNTGAASPSSGQEFELIIRK